jgi:hypothetical protein
MQLLSDWNREDRNLTNQFFSTPTGARFLETLRINAPKCIGSDLEQRALTGTEMQTWMNCINAMATLLVVDPDDAAGVDRLEQWNPNEFSSRVKT